MMEHAGYEDKTIRELIRDLEIMSSLSPVYSMRYLVHSVGYGTYAASAYKEGSKILEDLSSEAEEYQTLQQWQDRLGQLQMEWEDTAGKEHSKPSAGLSQAVKVLTMHACKGLEFDTVFIPDLN